MRTNHSLVLMICIWKKENGILSKSGGGGSNIKFYIRLTCQRREVSNINIFALGRFWPGGETRTGSSTAIAISQSDAKLFHGMLDFARSLRRRCCAVGCLGVMPGGRWLVVWCSLASCPGVVDLMPGQVCDGHCFAERRISRLQ